MGESYFVANRNKWLGTPATAYGVIPATAGLARPISTCLSLEFVRITNRHTSAQAGGLAGLLADSVWEAGQWVNATTTYTNDSTDAQDAGTNDFPLQTTTIADGHLVGADLPFGVISYDVTTASVGAAQEHTYKYWNGTAWTAIAAVGMMIDGPRTAGQTWAVGEQVVAFIPPSDWAKGGSGTGVNQARYNFLVQASVAATTAALARRLYVGMLLFGDPSLAANSGTFTVGPGQPIGIQPYAAHLQAFFPTASEGNMLHLVWHVL